jgi:ATP-dependent Clp protease ATP-binding subunit ClpX
MGARSLRSVVEECLLDLMFELPSREDVRRVTVTGATIRGEAGPEIGYRAETG